MKIYLLHAPNTYNYGSMMMAENFMYYFDKVSGRKNEYYVETDDPDNTLSRLKRATGMDNIKTAPMGSLFKGNRVSKQMMLQSLFYTKNLLSKFSHEIDLVIVLGGDDFTEDYGWIALVSQLIKLGIMAGSKKVYFIGQTMGPFYSFRVPLAKYFLAKAMKIYSRDRITSEYLLKLKLRNIDEIPDLALMPLAGEKALDGKKDQICIFPSQLIYRYSKNPSREDCINFYINICRYIADRYPGHSIKLIPHVLKPQSSDDRIAVNDIYEKLDDSLKARIIPIDKEMYPFEVRNEIKRCPFIVSARMHPIVSALECGVPGLCFAYSRKYWGIIGEGYGLKDLILDIRNYTYDEMFENFRMSLDKLHKSYDAIVGHIVATNKKDQELILEKMGELAWKASQ